MGKLMVITGRPGLAASQKLRKFYESLNIDVTEADTLEDLEVCDTMTLVILPSAGRLTEQAPLILEFQTDGGTVLVFSDSAVDETSNARVNQLLENIGSSLRFAPERHSFENYATPNQSHALVDRVTSLRLQTARYVSGGNSIAEVAVGPEAVKSVLAVESIPPIQKKDDLSAGEQLL